MEIIRMFGRAFSSSTAEEKTDDFAPSKENGDVVHKREQSRETAAGESQSQREVKRKNRISAVNFTVVEDVQEEHHLHKPNNYIGLNNSKKVEKNEEEHEEEEKGVDWESACYESTEIDLTHDIDIECSDVSAIDFNDHFIVTQFLVDPTIAVFDRHSKRFLYKLKGHSYGGSGIRLTSDDLLYSGSMDKTFRSWLLLKTEGQNKETIYNHLDYVQSIAVLPSKLH